MSTLPEYNEALVCERAECKEIEAEVMTGLYGVFGGGGPGAYTMCVNCGAVLSKSCDSHEEKPGIIEGEFSDVEEPASIQDRTTKEH
jgi:hypothetical protein